MTYSQEKILIESNIVEKITQVSRERQIPDCPNCHSCSAVILKTPEPKVVSHLQFKNKRAAKKYFKKKEKLGYDTDWDTIWPDLLTKQEMLTWIGVDKEKEKFYDTSYHWFCKKCIIIFK